MRVFLWQIDKLADKKQQQQKQKMRTDNYHNQGTLPTNFVYCLRGLVYSETFHRKYLF
jgi:hypothetical protein